MESRRAMNTTEILDGMKYWIDYDGSMRLACCYVRGADICRFPIGCIGYDDDYGVAVITVAEGDEEPTLDEFLDLCSQYDCVRVCGRTPDDFLQPVVNVWPSDKLGWTFDGELGEEVVVFELG